MGSFVTSHEMTTDKLRLQGKHDNRLKNIKELQKVPKRLIGQVLEKPFYFGQKELMGQHLECRDTSWKSKLKR